MIKFIKYFLIIFITLFIVIVLFYLTLMISMKGDSDEVKIKETKEAFEVIQFDKSVVDNLATINELTTFILDNYDEILNHCNLHSIDVSKPFRRKGVHIHKRSIEYTLPEEIGCPIDSLWKSVSNSSIGAIGIYNDKSISYRIYSKNRPTPSWNYRVYQDLNYGIITPTSSTLKRTTGYLSKDTIMQDYQYYIKLEPYIGW